MRVEDLGWMEKNPMSLEDIISHLSGCVLCDLLVVAEAVAKMITAKTEQEQLKDAADAIDASIDALENRVPPT